MELLVVEVLLPMEEELVLTAGNVSLLHHLPVRA